MTSPKYAACGIQGHLYNRARNIAPSLRALNHFLNVERPVSILIFGSFLLGIAYCVSYFDIAFLAGYSSFWINSRDFRGIAGLDISTAVSGYYFFVRSPWQFPLFHVSQLGLPGGIAIIFTDSIPLLALAGRLVYRITGEAVNFFGLWTAACFTLSAVSFTWLVAKLDQRSIAAATAAAVIGLSMPPLLWRWGNPALMAHFEILLALAYYFGCKKRCSPLYCFGMAALLSLLALWTNPYIFLMVEGIVFATIVQVLIDRALSLRAGVLVITGLSVLVAVIVVFSGHLDTEGSISGAGFGYYSMNVLSPVSPRMVDATGGQYEGFNYMGAGVLLLTFASLLSPERSTLAGIGWWCKGLISAWTKHGCLLAILLGFTVLSISNSVCVGPWLIMTVPIPSRVLEILSIFRSSGRLFWPVVYCIAVTTLVAVSARYRRMGIGLLFGASILQWIDVSPLREGVAASAAAPGTPLIDLSAWRQAISQHARVRVLPSFPCFGAPYTWTWSRQVAVQLQLLAALENVAINTVYAGRQWADCAKESGLASSPVPNVGELDVYLGEFQGFTKVKEVAALDKLPCLSSTRLIVCSQDSNALNLNAQRLLAFHSTE